MDGAGRRAYGVPRVGTAHVGPFDWDELYCRHAPDLRRLIARSIPGAAVDDVLQETFVRAFRSRDRFDPTRAEWPWLATLAYRSCAKWWRTHRSNELPVDHDAVEGVALTAPPGSDEHLLRLEQHRAATTALAQLAPRHRRVLYRHAAEDVPYERIAEDEAISPKALKSLLNRARVHFRDHYLRLMKESAAALGLGRAALARFRARLSGREVVLWERLAPMAGTVLAAGVVSALTMHGATPPANADSVRIAAIRSIDAAPSSTAMPPTTGTTAEAHPRSADGRPGLASVPPNRVSSAGTGATERAPVAVAAGGGIVPTGESPTAGIWVRVDDPLDYGTVEAGTTVRCDAGKVFTLECTILRLLPPAG
jgi:RNA polymerase sigma factor (sigma-70 family)